MCHDDPRKFLRRDDVELRLRPSFFPFVEPGFEVDVRIPGAPGRFGNWVELLGCGMVHPEVLRRRHRPRSQLAGFGLGLERLTMLRHGIEDIRLFNGADLRGLRKFSASCAPLVPEGAFTPLALSELIHYGRSAQMDVCAWLRHYTRKPFLGPVRRQVVQLSLHSMIIAGGCSVLGALADSLADDFAEFAFAE